MRRLRGRRRTWIFQLVGCLGFDGIDRLFRAFVGLEVSFGHAVGRHIHVAIVGARIGLPTIGLGFANRLFQGQIGAGGLAARARLSRLVRSPRLA